MTIIKNMKQLEQYVNKQAGEILYEKRNVFVEIAKQKVEKEVYEKYEPNLDNPDAYRRTGELKKSFQTTPIAQGIEIDNTRSENGRNIAEIVEKGHYKSQGYQYTKKDPVTGGDAAYMLPRPFMKETAQEIRDTKVHITELQKGLKRKGINATRRS